jgi:integrase
MRASKLLGLTLKQIQTRNPRPIQKLLRLTRLLIWVQNQLAPLRDGALLELPTLLPTPAPSAQKPSRIRVIQVLLGHAKLETTTIYTKVATKTIQNVTSPLDLLIRREAGPG